MARRLLPIALAATILFALSGSAHAGQAMTVNLTSDQSDADRPVGSAS